MELTEFELGLKAIIETYFLDDNHTDEKLFRAIRKIMPLTCFKNERAFLDEIREKYKLKTETVDGVKYVYLSNAPSLIYQSDFTRSNLSELVEGKG